MFSGKIIECSWDMEEGAWVFMRVRVDKSTPNEYKTYRKVSPLSVFLFSLLGLSHPHSSSLYDSFCGACVWVEALI